jgi:hypothetical protein
MKLISQWCAIIVRDHATSDDNLIVESAFGPCGH